ncbi:MAG: hypothetical protein ACOCXJ_06340, partial [Planctomycetota bacterium]
TVAALVPAYRALAEGADGADATIRRLADATAPAGLFPGHLATGSRALDAVQGGPPTAAPGGGGDGGRR